jgi:Heterokaryon incompatibility protein (HET)
MYLLLVLAAILAERPLAYWEPLWHLRIYNGLTLTGDFRNVRNYPATHILALIPGKPVRHMNSLIKQASLILPTKNPLSAPVGSNRGFWGAKPLENNNFRWRHARRWINECVDTHTTCPNLDDLPKVPIKVVDCQTRAIVPYRTGQYIALSYVWGVGTGLTADEAKQLTKSKVLPAKVPQTIEDALKAVLYLGERYLWVDQYCISQYHAKEKEEQIGAMADIYGCALLTIVALGSNVDAGLEGVTSARKHHQHSVSVGDQKLVWAMPGLDECLRSSVWSTRAWTYQEVLLSLRCLVITKYQFFFVCALGTVCEVFPDLGCEQVRSASPWDRNYMNPTMLLPSNPRDGDAQTRLEVHFNEYKRRDLSYQLDALNAFCGILAKSGLQSYWGVPVFDIIPPERGLAYGLLWKSNSINLSSQQRRPEFPTWTWASTAYKFVSFPWTWTCSSGTNMPAEHAQIRIAREHTHAVQNLNDIASLSAHRIITEHGRSLLLTSYVTSCTFQFRRSHSDGRLATEASCWIDAPFVHSDQRAEGHLDGEGYDGLRTNHGATDNGGFDKHECEAIMMLRESVQMGWMLIIRKSSFYVRLGVVELFQGPDKEPWAPTPLEQTTIELH